MAKSKYETVVEPNLARVRDWCRDGVSDKEIAERLGVAYSTFRLYRDKHSALSAVLSRTKEVVDSEVVNAAFKRALGYDAEEYEEIYNYIYDSAGNLVEERLVSKRYKKRHIPADPQLLQFWLTHRQRANWGTMIEVQDGETGGVVMISERDIIDMPKNERG